MKKKQAPKKKPTANKSPLITVHRGTLQSLKDEAANADIAHREIARISKAQQAEIEFLKSERDAAIAKQTELQELLDNSVKLASQRLDEIGWLKKQAEERESSLRELIKDNNRMREMGPKSVLRAVKKLADQILDDYDDGLE